MPPPNWYSGPEYPMGDVWNKPDGPWAGATSSPISASSTPPARTAEGPSQISLQSETEVSTVSAERVAVLDHGYVEFVESWGSDERVIEAARMSNGKGFQGWDPHWDDAVGAAIPGDAKLLRFLWENGHHTPFEM